MLQKITRWYEQEITLVGLKIDVTHTIQSKIACINGQNRFEGSKMSMVVT